jgi:hypothetical protein
MHRKSLVIIISLKDIYLVTQSLLNYTTVMRAKKLFLLLRFRPNFSVYM